MSNRQELFKEMFKPETIEPKNVTKPASISLLKPEVLDETDTSTPNEKDNPTEKKLDSDISKFSREFELNASEDTLKELWLQGKRKNIMSEERFLKEMQGFL